MVNVGCCTVALTKCWGQDRVRHARPDLAMLVATRRLHMSESNATTHVTQWTDHNTDTKHDREQGAWRRCKCFHSDC